MSKGKKILAIAVMGVMLLSTMAFADETVAPQQTNGNNSTAQTAPTKVDPITRLENLKAKITEKYNEGKISKDKMDNLIAKINNVEQKIKDFNNLTLDQKKQKLISDFTTDINKRVQEGKLTQDKANELIKNYTDKVNKWDGNGYPPEISRMYKGFLKNFGKYENSYAKFKNALDQAVKDNKITSQQEQDILNYLKGSKNKSGKTSSGTSTNTTNTTANTL